MRRQQKKAFTLVELLVVIAILAILASVAVVGYTSFIKNAAVSNDENLASQMNRYFEALKADSTSAFYGAKKLTEDEEILALIAEITTKGGLKEIKSEAEKYGYHFYFNIEKQKFETLDNEDALYAHSGYSPIWTEASATDPEPQSWSPYTCFTQGGNYFFADTTGDWYELIQSYSNVKTSNDLKDLYTGATEMEVGNQPVPGLALLVEKTVFVTENGNHVVANTDKNGNAVEHNTVVVQPSATQAEVDKNNDGVVDENDKNDYIISGTKTGLGGNDDTADITAANPLIKPTEQGQKVEIPADVTYVAPEFISNIVETDAKVTVNDEEVSANVTVTLNTNDIEEIKKLFDVGTETTNSSVTIQSSTGAEVKVETSTETDAEGFVTITTTLKVGETETNIDPQNTVSDFNYYFVYDEDIKNFDPEGNFISFDNTNIELMTNNFIGNKGGEVISTQVRWTIESPYYYNDNGEKVLIESDPEKGYDDYFECSPLMDDSGKVVGYSLTVKMNNYPDAKFDGFTLKATPVYATNDDVYKAIEIKVVRPVGLYDSVKLGGEDVDFINTVTLVNGEKDADGNTVNSTFALTGVKLRYNYAEAEGKIELNDDVVLEPCDEDIFNVSEDKQHITLVDTERDLLTPRSIWVRVGNNYINETITVEMYNQYDLTFVHNTDNSKIVLIGDDNPITVGDLLVLQDKMDVPENAQVWFMKDFGTQYAKPGAISASGFAVGYGPDDDAEDNLLKIELNDNDAWNSTPIQFAGGETASNGAQEVTVVIVVPDGDGYRCISQPRSVSIVDGYNIKSGEYSTLKTQADAGKSIVLLGDVTMDVANSYFTIGAEKTFYGNCFTLDISENGYMGGDETIGNIGYGIIGLYGNIQDTKIIGKVYGTFAGSASDKFGTNLIVGYDGSKITNCYLSNTRSPLVVMGKVTVEDTVIFGGRYANVDVRAGELNIVGDVTTVQQLVSGVDENGDTVNVVGIGIACWFEDYRHSVIVAEGANFKQYTFLDEGNADLLPPLKYSGVTLMELKKPFTELFAEKYGDYQYGDGSYVNSGVVSIDKYMFNYDVDVPEAIDLIILTGYKKGSEVKITIKANEDMDNASFTIHYDSNTYRESDNTSDGKLEVSGLTLTKGSTQTYSLYFKNHTATIGNAEYQFNITGNDFVALDVSGLDGYVNTEYSYALGDALTSLAGSIGNLHGKGIHYNTMSFDIWTPDKNTDANDQLFKQYLAMTTENVVDKDGNLVDENGISYYGYFTPETYRYVDRELPTFTGQFN